MFWCVDLTYDLLIKLFISCTILYSLNLTKDLLINLFIFWSVDWTFDQTFDLLNQLLICWLNFWSFDLSTGCSKVNDISFWASWPWNVHSFQLKNISRSTAYTDKLSNHMQQTLRSSESSDFNLYCIHSIFQICL